MSQGQVGDPDDTAIDAVVDTLIVGAQIVTMDRARRIINDGAVATTGSKITAVGKRTELELRYRAHEVVQADGFVLTPGLIDAHIHITGDPLTRGYIPDDLEGGLAGENLAKWVIPRFISQTPADERLSALLAAVEMLRSGTTCFLEAGTIRHLDAVIEGLQQTGIRGRVGTWVEGRAYGADDDQAELNAQAIRTLHDEVERYPAGPDAKIGAWPILIGHSTNSDEVWRAAKALADKHGIGFSAHMSPYQTDPDWYLANVGCRPIEHLANLGVLGRNLALTHVTHIDDQELALLAQSQTNVTFCPRAALKGGFGVTVVGRYPEMQARGVNLTLGTDGSGTDLPHELDLMSALFKDARQDPRLFPAHETLEMATLNGARMLGLQDTIGSIEIGKQADLVLHDTTRPEWTPRLNVVNQLVWSADGRDVHSVWVGGSRVVDNYRCTLVDEAELFDQAQSAAEALVSRCGVPSIEIWPSS